MPVAVAAPSMPRCVSIAPLSTWYAPTCSARGRGPCCRAACTPSFKTRRELAVPDIQFLFRGAPSRAHPWFPGLTPAYEDSFGLRPVMLHPESRGVVRLRSADPSAPVRIGQNFLATENDVRTIRGGAKLRRDIARRKGIDP